MGLLPEVHQPEVQENGLVVRTHCQRPVVDGDGLVRAVGARVDDAQIAQRSYVARLNSQHALEAALRVVVITGG